MLQRLDTDRKDIFLYVPLVTSDWHMFTIESYIQGESVMPINEDASNGPLLGWQLQGGDDGTQVCLSNQIFFYYR